MTDNAKAITEKTLMPLSLVATVVSISIWSGRIETKVEAHDKQFVSNAVLWDRQLEIDSRRTEENTKIREALSRIEGLLERRRH